MSVKIFKYSISYNAKKPNHILFNFSLNVADQDTVRLSLPVWRPGRYERADYAQYIKAFQVWDEKKRPLNVQKKSPSQWSVDCKSVNKLNCSYSFYSNRIDAGFSYADSEQIYLNPVNCFFYLENKNCAYEIAFKNKNNFELHSPLNALAKGKVYASSYYELFDAPMIYSKSAKVQKFKVDNYTIKNVFQGLCEPNTEKIKRDYTKFIQAQVQAFGDLPVKEFTFLNQITTHAFYHGVEHKKNTVLAYGPGYLLDEKAGYENFLGLASHEFYHIWNVKHLRPKELFPYDFGKANLHQIGWIIEGVTTYQGDVKLWQSKVFNDKIYFKLLAEQFERHLNNSGRFNESVRTSSMDLWVDGYTKGTTGKKVSIYTEGSLIAFIIDILLLEKTNGKNGLDTVMKAMYQNFAKKNRAYSETDFLNEIKAQGGSFINRVYKNLIDKNASYETELLNCLKKLGLALEKKAISLEKSYLGVNTSAHKHPQVLSVTEGSPAEEAGLVEKMTILAINGIEVSKNLEKWLTYFYGSTIKLTCSLHDKISEHKLQLSETSLRNKILIKQKEGRTKAQELLFRHWRKF